MHILLQPFASYRLALRKEQVLKSYNYVVWPLKLFVLTLKLCVLTLKLFVLILKRRMGGVKTISYKQLVTDLLAVKLLLRMLLTKLSDVYLNVSPCCMQKIHC